MRSHNENRAAICALCFNRTKEMRKMSLKQEETIKIHFIKQYSVNEVDYPISLCSTCRLTVEEYAKGNFKRKVKLFDYSKINTYPRTRSNLIINCFCTLCSIAKTNLNSTARYSLKKRVGRPSINKLSSRKKNTNIQICKNCFVTVKKGKSHDCRKSLRTQNFAQLASLSNSPKFKEKFVSTIIKEKVENSVPNSCVQLETGNKGKLNIIASNKKVPTVQNNAVTIEDISEMQRTLNLSTNNTIKLASCLQKLKSKTNKKITESYVKTKLQEKRHVLDTLFDKMTAELENGQENKHESVQRDIIFCKDILAFLDFIVQKRNLTQKNVELLKIGLDGGGGFFKVCLNIQTKETTNRGDLKDSGVKKLFILAIVKNIKENYFNVLYIWKLLKIDELGSYSISTDLKLANILMGLMSHSSAFPCTWCQSNAQNLNNEGDLRTFENIRNQYLRWTASGSSLKKAKHFFNCIHEPIPQKLGEPVILVIPPPELHLLLGNYYLSRLFIYFFILQ